MGVFQTHDLQRPVAPLILTVPNFKKERVDKDIQEAFAQEVLKTTEQAKETFDQTAAPSEPIPVSKWSMFSAAAGVVFQNASSFIGGIGNIRSLFLKGWGYLPSGMKMVAIPVSAWMFWKWCKNQVQTVSPKEGVVINIHNHVPAVPNQPPLDTQQVEAIAEKVAQILKDEKGLRNEEGKC